MTVVTSAIATIALLGLGLGLVEAEHHVVPEIAMPTDVGEVVLTIEECSLHPFMDAKYHQDYKFRAYATDSNAEGPHEGCWTRMDKDIYIQFPELGDIVTAYKADLFIPRHLEPKI